MELDLTDVRRQEIRTVFENLSGINVDEARRALIPNLDYLRSSTITPDQAFELTRDTLMFLGRYPGYLQGLGEHLYLLLGERVPPAALHAGEYKGQSIPELARAHWERRT